ncbi:MAG: hypothetical protein Q8859_08840, partial [Bacteroidota bacterium]|nr:hypothetical protein [Bacteroidota bacterium]
INPREQAFLYDLRRVKNKLQPQVLASASRIYSEKIYKGSYAFTSVGPLKTVNSMRILLPFSPKKISVMDKKENTISDVKMVWDNISKTCYLSFGNNPEGVDVKIMW